MKLILLLHVIVWMMMGSCNMLDPKDDVVSFIPGTYVSQWTTEFAESRDTLQIRPGATKGSVHYEITRRTYHRYNQDAKKMPPQYKMEKWTAGYEPDDKILLVHSNGRVLSFDTKNKSMKMGVTVYKKL